MAKLFAFKKIAQYVRDCRSHLCAHGHTQPSRLGLRPAGGREVVDEPHELPYLAVDHVTGACGSRRSSAALDTLDREPVAGKRVAQLVRKRREEFVLALIRLHQRRGPVAYAQLQVAIQRLSMVLRRRDSRRDPDCRSASVKGPGGCGSLDGLGPIIRSMFLVMR
jgi:hypothetical protein